MKDLFMMLVLAASGLSGAAYANHDRLVYTCQGTIQKDLSVRVFQDSDVFTGIVWQDSEIVARKTLKVSYSRDRAAERIVFQGGDVLGDGFNLRIFTRHTHPEIVGQGHITIRIKGKTKNAALLCSDHEDEPPVDPTLTPFIDVPIGGSYDPLHGDLPWSKILDLGGSKTVVGIGVLTDWWLKRPTYIAVAKAMNGRWEEIASKDFPSYLPKVCGQDFASPCSYPDVDGSAQGQLFVPVPPTEASELKIAIDGLLDAANQYVILDTIRIYYHD